MNTTVRIALTALIILTGAAGSAAQSGHGSVVGSWRLVSWVVEEIETKAVTKEFGDNPVGTLTYTADGRMSVFFISPNRKSPASPRATDTEAAELYRTMVAYSGTYSIEGDKVTHKIELSWNQAWNGTNQVRFIEVKGNQLIIKTPPFVSPAVGKKIVSTLVWERIK